MNKYLRNFIGFSMLLLSLVSCNTDETSTADIEQKNLSGLKSGNWDGVIATELKSGGFEFNVAPEVLMHDLEVHLSQNGDDVDLQSISIERKAATNDPKEFGYMLIATDGNGVSVGIMLVRDETKDGGRDFSTDPDPSTITCRGCATGCNLEHLNMPGGKVPYCNSNGCGDFCQTKYAS